MRKEHHVVVLPGLSDDGSAMQWLTKDWQAKYNITPHITIFNWHGTEDEYPKRLETAKNVIESLLNTYKTISLLGVSAGASATVNLFDAYKDNISHDINLISFAGWKKYISLYPIPTGDTDYHEKIQEFRSKKAKSTLQFPIDESIPYKLISETATFLKKEKVKEA